MKKVLFISLANYQTLGGTQNYNYKLMKLFLKRKWSITEYNCNLGIDKIVRKPLPNIKTINNSSKLTASTNRFIEGKKFMKQVKVSNAEIAILLKENNYDLIIDARQHPYVWKKGWGNDLSKTDKMIWIQHFCLGLYDGKVITKNRFEAFFVYLYTNFFSKYRYNVLYSHKNIVLFDKFNKQKLNNNRFKKKDYKIHEIALSEYTKKYIDKQKIKINKSIDFLYVGRINEVQKNINYINKVFKNIDNKLIVLGAGNKKEEKKISKNKNIEFLGYCKQDKVISYFKKSKFLILPSKYEGFPYVIVQALSHGCIPIILNTYESANFFKEVSIVLEKNTSINQYRKIMLDALSKYNNDYAKNAINFAKKFLSENEFEKKWINIIKQYED